MTGVDDFISRYTPDLRKHIDFAWNGKHADEFEDLNQVFRWEIVNRCRAQPELASINLLEHLFLADAEWTTEAWGPPRHFANLGELLLKRGQVTALETFSLGYVRSFDTFGACHEIRLNSELLPSLAAASKEVLASAVDECQRKRFEAVFELLAKINSNTATQGWVTVMPNTPLSNLRVVWPRWRHKFWSTATKFLK
jgi:hypothetical protein